MSPDQNGRSGKNEQRSLHLISSMLIRQTLINDDVNRGGLLSIVWNVYATHLSAHSLEHLNVHSLEHFPSIEHFHSREHCFNSTEH